VLSINGIATPDWGAFIEARNANKTAMLVEIFRNGAILKIEVELSASPIDPQELLAELIADHVVPLDPSIADESKN
jgi:hypothetical protein